MSVRDEIDSWLRVLVYGLGASGRAAARLLLEHGVPVVGVDARPPEELDLAELADHPSFEVYTGDDPMSLPDLVDAVIVSPGVPSDRPLLSAARRRHLPVLAEVELAFAFLDGPLVGITGSNGKSTTTALTGAMIAAGGRAVEVCGNIGEPLSEAVQRALRRGGEPPVFVVELSSFQLEAIEGLRPHAAAMLNLSPDHLDRHGDLAGYAAAKRRIFENQEPGDVAVLNAGDPVVAATWVPGRRRQFAAHSQVPDGCQLDGERVIEVAPGQEPTLLFYREEVPLPGEHNLENAMAAALLARAMGTEPAAIREALTDFRGLPHRLERVAHAGGVTWFDDSKGTNPAATLRSLEGFDDGTVHLILGGRNKGSDFTELATAAARKARRVYLIGEAADELARALAGTAATVERADTLERAVVAAAEHANAGEVVLLSPACASFDQFRDFNHRGEVFHHLVAQTVEGGDGQEAGL